MASNQSTTTNNAPWEPVQPLYQQAIDAATGYSDWFKNIGPGGSSALDYGQAVLQGMPKLNAPSNPLLDPISGGQGQAALAATNQIPGYVNNQNEYDALSKQNYNQYIDPSAQFNRDLMAGNWDSLGVIGKAMKSALGTLGANGGGAGGYGGGNFTFNMPKITPSQIDQATMQAAIKAATNPMYDQLNKVTMPGLNSSAVNAGRYGSNAWAAQGDLANMGANRVAGEVGAKIGYDTMAKNAELNNAAQIAGMNAAAQGASAAASSRAAANRLAFDQANSLLGFGSGLIKRQDELAGDSYQRYKDAVGFSNQGEKTASQLWGDMLPTGQAYAQDMANKNATDMANFNNQLNLPINYLQSTMNLGKGTGGSSSQTTIPQYDPSTLQYITGGLTLADAMDLFK